MRMLIIMAVVTALAAPAFADCASERAICLAQNAATYRVDKLDCRALVASDRAGCADVGSTEYFICDTDADTCGHAARLIEADCAVEIPTDAGDCFRTAHEAKVETDRVCVTAYRCER